MDTDRFALSAQDKDHYRFATALKLANNRADKTGEAVNIYSQGKVALIVHPEQETSAITDFLKGTS
jgi:4-hydroxyphenylpyruvate dioxygenase-like putative hemolysin